MVYLSGKQVTLCLQVANAKRTTATAATAFTDKRFKEVQEVKHFLHVLLGVKYIFCSLFHTFKTCIVECNFFLTWLIYVDVYFKDILVYFDYFLNLSNLHSAVIHPQVCRLGSTTTAVPWFTEVVEFAYVYIFISTFMQTMLTLCCCHFFVYFDLLLGCVLVTVTMIGNI